MKARGAMTALRAYDFTAKPAGLRSAPSQVRDSALHPSST
jgi:hypothetical protein